MDRYCHRSLLEKVTGSEGALEGTDSDSYELLQVQLVARHGDRTPLANFGLKPRVNYHCGVHGNKDTVWLALKDIKPTPLPPHAKVTNAKTNLQSLLDDSGGECKPGHLTETGAHQHRMLGAYFAEKYSSLAKIPSHDTMFVHSTNYMRTIHSAAAFLVGFLPSDPSLRQPIPLYVSTGTILSAPPIGIPVNYPTCSRLNAVKNDELKASSYLTSAQLKKPTFDRLLEAAGVDKTFNPSFTEMFDQLWSRLCHNLSLPCNRETCVNYSLALEGGRLAQWSFANSHPLNSSILTAQPFLYHTVLSEMESAIHSGAGGLPYYRFTFSFSHDSLLTPLLNVLSLPQNEWVPYASRLVFELWRKKGALRNEDDSYYVRLLFNGQSLTHRLVHIDESYFAVEQELVSYPAWVETLVSGPYRDIQLYKEVCS